MHTNSSRRPDASAGSRVSRRRFLEKSAVSAGLLSVTGLGALAAQPPVSADEERQRIEKALPAKALVTPLRPRKLLIFDLNVNYGGHPSIRTANLAFQLMGQKTGAYETVISRDPAVFEASNLKQFDAVFFNNTVGNCFTEPQLRQNLVEFVYGGGGLLGVHGSSVAFTKWPGAIEDWPEFGLMIGARGANHRDSDEHVFIALDDPTHPLNKVFGKDFDYRDEFFRVHEPYSRKRVRVLLRMDNEKTPGQGQARGQVLRQDNDYAVAWVRQYGRGRTFYCTIAHNPYVFWDAKMLEFYLGSVQFALGDLPAPTTPSAKLTPEIKVQESLQWRLGLPAGVFPANTLFEDIDQAAALGLLHVGAREQQKVGGTSGKNFDCQLEADERREIRLKLDTAGVRLLAYQVEKVPNTSAERRKLCEFARTMGVEILVAPAPVEGLAELDQLCGEYDLQLAISSAYQNNVSPDRQIKELLPLCEGRSKRVGLCGDLALFKQADAPLVKTIQMLGDRLLIVQIPSMDQLAGPGGTALSSVNNLASALSEIHKLGLKPAMFAFGGRPGTANTAASLSDSIRYFNGIILPYFDKKLLPIFNR